MKRSPELEAVFRRIWDAVIAEDVATLGNHFSSESGLRSIAVAEDEWWQGHDSIVDLFTKRVAEVGVARLDYHRLEAFENGKVGWTAADVTIVTRDDARFRRRFTGTYQLEDGAWRVVQWHASMGVPNEAAWGFELAGSLAGLVESLDEAAAEEIDQTAVGGTVTVMFTDVENSTRISSEVGDQAWLDLIECHFESLRRITERWGGKLIKTLGDGAMMTFPSAAAGIGAAIETQESQRGSDLRVRVGIHTGDAMPLAGDYVGVTVAKAARVASAAAGGEVLVSSVTAALTTDPRIRYGSTREVELKGLAGIHLLLPVIWTKPD